MVVRERLRDIDDKIRETLHTLLKTVLIHMENDIADNRLVEELFLPLINDSNSKVL